MMSLEKSEHAQKIVPLRQDTYIGMSRAKTALFYGLYDLSLIKQHFGVAYMCFRAKAELVLYFQGLMLAQKQT